MDEEGLVMRAVESAGLRQENTGQANSAVYGAPGCFLLCVLASEG